MAYTLETHGRSFEITETEKQQIMQAMASDSPCVVLDRLGIVAHVSSIFICPSEVTRGEEVDIGYGRTAVLKNNEWVLKGNPAMKIDVTHEPAILQYLADKKQKPVIQEPEPLKQLTTNYF